jgi:hypothetical protein
MPNLEAVRPLDEIIKTLILNTSVLQEKQILAGFDGFIDTIVKPVKKTGLNGQYEYFNTISEFGLFIGGHSHKGTSIQYEIQRRKPGGNMPNFVKAMDSLSLNPIAVGMLSTGSGDIDPLFAGLGKQRYSFLAAGPATPLEFSDGKIFLSPVNLAGVDQNEKIYSRIEKVFPQFSNAAAGSDLIAFLNWSELPFAQDLWDDIYIHAFNSASTDKTRFAFFDLCDTSAKNQSEIEAVISVMRKIGERRGTILSMNKNEALDICLKITGQSRSITETAELLFRQLHIDELIIHQHTGSIAIHSGGMATEACVFNRNPKISTGAGDHFNAAYCFATLAGLPIAEKLRFANAYSGAYIAKGSSPALREIINT